MIRDPYVAAYAAALKPGLPDRRRDLGARRSSPRWLLEERPLRQTVADQGLGDSFAAPRAAGSMRRAGGTAQLTRAQARTASRLRPAGGRSGLDLDARETWLLLRLDADEGDPTRLADELALQLDGLRRRALVRPTRPPLTRPDARPRRGSPRSLWRDPAASRRVEPDEHPAVLRLIERSDGSSRSAPAPADVGLGSRPSRRGRRRPRPARPRGRRRAWRRRSARAGGRARA